MRLFRSLTVILFIGLGLLALGWFSWNIGLTYLGLVSDTTSEKLGQDAGNAAVDTVFTLPEIRFWTCQVGVYSQEANAKREVDRLKALGLPASLFSSAPWSVGIGYASNPEGLEALKDKLTLQGINAYLKEVRIEEQSYKIGGKGAGSTIRVLKGVNSILRVDHKDGAWNETISLVSETFKEGVPRELYSIGEEFKAFAAEDDNLAPLKRLSLSMRYRETLMHLTNKFQGVL